jgi:hypothetical protein
VAEPVGITGPTNLVSNPEVPVSQKHSCMSTPSDTSGIFSSAKEELKVLEFKLQQGMLTKKDGKHLVVLAGEGGNTFGLPFDLGPDGDNALGLGL